MKVKLNLYLPTKLLKHSNGLNYNSYQAYNKILLSTTFQTPKYFVYMKVILGKLCYSAILSNFTQL